MQVKYLRINNELNIFIWLPPHRTKKNYILFFWFNNEQLPMGTALGSKQKKLNVVLTSILFNIYVINI